LPELRQDEIEYEVYGVIYSMRSQSAFCRVGLTGGAKFIRGDVNLDGRIQLSDAVLVLHYLFGRTTLPCLDAADYDDNGKLQITDPIGILLWLFSGGKPPVPPRGEPGPDPTPDNLTCEKGLET